MPRLRFTQRGDLQKTKDFMNRIARGDIFSDLAIYGRMGVSALSRATPKDTGDTSVSWGYRIIKDKTHPGIEWYNTNVDPQGTQIAILIQFGHATKSRGYVPGYDYINPALEPVFLQIENDVWKKVNSA